MSCIYTLHRLTSYTTEILKEYFGAVSFLVDLWQRLQLLVGRFKLCDTKSVMSVLCPSFFISALLCTAQER